LREGIFFEKSLPVVILGAVEILKLELISSSSLSPKEDKATASDKTFLKTKEAETLFEKHLATQ